MLQGIDGRLGVDQRAAAGVNHHHSVLHLIESPAIEQMVVFVGQRAVQGDHVRLLVQRGEVDIFHPQLQRGGAWVRVERQQTHAKTFEDPQHRHANFPGANHPGGFAIHGETGEAFQGEISITGTLVGAVDAAVKRHHHADRMLSHRFRRVGRDAHDAQAKLFRRLEVDVVKPGAAQGDILHAVGLQLLQHRTAAVVIDEDAYRFATVGGFGGFLCQQEVEEFQFKAVGIIHVLQVLFIVLLRTVNRDFHKTFLQ